MSIYSEERQEHLGATWYLSHHRTSSMKDPNMFCFEPFFRTAVSPVWEQNYLESEGLVPETRLRFLPFRTELQSVAFWGHTAQRSTGLPPERDCRSRRKGLKGQLTPTSSTQQ